MLYDVVYANMGQKMLKFWKVALENHKTGKLFVALATLNF